MLLQGMEGGWVVIEGGLTYSEVWIECNMSYVNTTFMIYVRTYTEYLMKLKDFVYVAHTEKEIDTII